MIPTAAKIGVLYRPTATSHGAISNAETMTEPRPRLTKITGSVQQTSVVSDDARPIAVSIRGRMFPPLLRDETPRASKEDQISRGTGCRCGGSCGRLNVGSASHRRGDRTTAAIDATGM